jgi:hypothetical protein
MSRLKHYNSIRFKLRTRDPTRKTWWDLISRIQMQSPTAKKIVFGKPYETFVTGKYEI